MLFLQLQEKLTVVCNVRLFNDYIGTEALRTSSTCTASSPDYPTVRPPDRAPLHPFALPSGQADGRRDGWQTDFKSARMLTIEMRLEMVNVPVSVIP